ncbi:MAG: EamA family transporter [Candidatus Auribacterota bacterium]|jgi:drug/metabolite transporter (DMT)-like permease|nr:EamA family transporter [Candidatus Auribacterota bacterium]
MIWSVIALASALSVSIADSLTKKYLSGFSVFVVFWVRIAYTLPVLLVCSIGMTIPKLPAEFWIPMVPLVFCEVLAGVFYARALQVSPLSLTIPFMAFSPVFLIIVGYLILGEKVSPTGMLGIVLVTIGAYLLNIHHNKYGILGPIRAVFHERGSWMMLLVAVLYSFSASFGKKALLYAGDPYFFSWFYMLVVSIVSFPVMYVLSGRRGRMFVSHPKIFMLVGTAMGLMVITHFVAVQQMNVAYMISLKRMNLVFSVIIGYFLFREERLIQNSIACIMMICGAFLVSIAR